MSGKPILEVRNLWKQYKIGGEKASYLSLREQLLRPFQQAKTETFWALQDINFDVFEGESIGIVGRNGAGKSTLLKILSQITPPTRGHVKVRGRIASLLEVGTGFHPELTGRENVYLNGSILGLRKAEIEAKFDEIVDFSGVEKFLETPLKHYSSGMRLRLAFSVAAHLEPEILLIDEVLAVGDAEFQKKCLGKMDEVSKSGRTVLFVSHNLGAVRQLCANSIFFQNGKLVSKGQTELILDSYLAQSKEEMRAEIYDKDFGTFKVVKMASIQTCGYERVDTEIFIHLRFEKPNKVTDFSILLYNEQQIRVGIIDFRQDIGRLGSCTEFELRCKMEAAELVEGIYSLGFYINSSFVQGNYLDLVAFEIKDEDSFGKYPKTVRGIIELKKNWYEIKIPRTTW